MFVLAVTALCFYIKPSVPFHYPDYFSYLQTSSLPATRTFSRCALGPLEFVGGGGEAEDMGYLVLGVGAFVGDLEQDVAGPV